jgi:5-formyltetrahydrofolate cyclo-ligase
VNGRSTSEVDWSEIKAWQRAERERLIAERLTISADERARRAEAIIAKLDQLDIAAGAMVSQYWPIRGEFDLRALVASLAARGVHGALPVVTERNQPMSFRRWAPGMRMKRGIWNIPIPADGSAVVPDVAIAPLISHDPDC